MSVTQLLVLPHIKIHNANQMSQRVNTASFHYILFIVPINVKMNHKMAQKIKSV